MFSVQVKQGRPDYGTADGPGRQICVSLTWGGERGEVDRSDRIKLGVRDNYQCYGSLTQSVMIVSTQYLNILLGSKILNKKIIYVALCGTELFTIDDKHITIFEVILAPGKHVRLHVGEGWND